MKKSYKTIGIAVLVGVFVIYLLFSYVSGGKKELVKNQEESIFVEEEPGELISEEKKKIVVEIKGEVSNPNIYYLEDGSIINDLINEAGGLTANANINGINRAELLSDHVCIVIPNKNEEELMSNGDTDLIVSPKSDKVNINTASVEELDTLPGIGPSRAADIISYRESNGRFKSIEDLKNVKGIGEASFEKMKEKITI